MRFEQLRSRSKQLAGFGIRCAGDRIPARCTRWQIRFGKSFGVRLVAADRAYVPVRVRHIRAAFGAEAVTVVFHSVLCAALGTGRQYFDGVSYLAAAGPGARLIGWRHGLTAEWASVVNASFARCGIARSHIGFRPFRRPSRQAKAAPLLLKHGGSRCPCQKTCHSPKRRQITSSRWVFDGFTLPPLLFLVPIRSLLRPPACR